MVLTESRLTSETFSLQKPGKNTPRWNEPEASSRYGLKRKLLRWRLMWKSRQKHQQTFSKQLDARALLVWASRTVTNLAAVTIPQYFNWTSLLKPLTTFVTFNSEQSKSATFFDSERIMAGKLTAGSGILLVTANVGSLFEDVSCFACDSLLQCFFGTNVIVFLLFWLQCIHQCRFQLISLRPWYGSSLYLSVVSTLLHVWA